MASVSEVDAGMVVTVTVSALTTATSLKAAPAAALSMRLSGLAGLLDPRDIDQLPSDLFIQGKIQPTCPGPG